MRADIGRSYRLCRRLEVTAQSQLEPPLPRIAMAAVPRLSITAAEKAHSHCTLVLGDTLERDAKRLIQLARERTNPFDLRASPFVAQRPRAEVFAVVAQQPIAPFAQPRARALHHFTTIEASLLRLNPDSSAVRETLERNLFHRAAPQPVCKTSVVDDTSIADVDAVVRMEGARRDEM